MLEWRVVSEFPEYEISDSGDLRWREDSSSDWRGKRLRGRIGPEGYLEYNFTYPDGRKTVRSAHRLVAIAFISDPPFDGAEVAHNNGSRVLNHYSNLRWCTPKENAEDRELHGRTPRGSRNTSAKLTEEQAFQLRLDYQRSKLGLSNVPIASIVEKYHMDWSSIIRIGSGKGWKHVPMPTMEQLESLEA